MEYRLRPGEALGEEVRRIVCGQLDAAIGELTGGPDPHRGVHEARKCFKRARALLRLVRPALGQKSFKREDKRIRAIARRLSAPRDCQAMIETVSLLEDGGGNVWDTATGQSFKAQLHRDRMNAEAELRRNGLAAALDDLTVVREGYGSRKPKGSMRYLADGLERSYHQARRDFKRSFKTGRDEDFHNWRKSAQHHWRHMQLLWHAWPAAMGARAETASELSRLLGQDHDLSVLMLRLRKGAAPYGANGKASFIDICTNRQGELREASLPRGERLFAERPREFCARVIAYWRAAPLGEMPGEPAVVAAPAAADEPGAADQAQVEAA